MELVEFNRTMVTNDQVLVFSSSINNAQSAALVSSSLMKMNSVYHANVDLEDWENILRVECEPDMCAFKIEEQVGQLGFECSELED